MSEAILHITAGKGPQECHWVVAGLARAFAREAKGMRLDCEMLDGMKAWSPRVPCRDRAPDPSYRRRVPARRVWSPPQSGRHADHQHMPATKVFIAQNILAGRAWTEVEPGRCRHT